MGNSNNKQILSNTDNIDSDVPEIFVGDNNNCIDVSNNSENSIRDVPNSNGVPVSGLSDYVDYGSTSVCVRVVGIGDYNNNEDRHINRNITGDITGDITYDITGDITCDITGDITGDITYDSYLRDGIDDCNYFERLSVSNNINYHHNNNNSNNNNNNNNNSLNTNNDNNLNNNLSDNNNIINNIINNNTTTTNNTNNTTTNNTTTNNNTATNNTTTNNNNNDMIITTPQNQHDSTTTTNKHTTSSVWAVELMFLLYKIAESILEPTVRLYLYESVCLNLYPNAQHHFVCDHLRSDRVIEHDVQNNAARYMLYYKSLINFPAMVVVLCCGAWSDSSGRTTPIILTCLGTVLAVLAYMISSFDIFHGTPCLQVILMGAGIRGVFGRSAIMTMAVNSYISDNSPIDIRTQRLSNLAAMSHFGYLLGSSSAGFLLDRCGYSTVFVIVIVIDTVCVFVAYGCMRDHTANESSVFGNMLHDRESTDEEKPLLPDTPKRPRAKSHCCHTISTSEDFIIIQVPNERHTPTSGARPITQSRRINFEKDTMYSASLPTGIMNRYMGDGMKISEVNRTNCRSFDWSDMKERINESDKELKNECDDAFVVPINDKSDVLMNIPSNNVTQGRANVSNVTKPHSSKVDDVQPPKKSSSIASSLFGSFQVLIRERTGRLRYDIWALFIVIYLHQMNKSGDQDIYLLFTKRTPLSVSRSMYGYLLSANYAFLGMFAFFIPKLFNLIGFHAKDSTLAMTGLIFKIISLIVLFFSKNVWTLVLSAVLSGPHSLTVSTVKSMVSKIVESGEIGRTFSLMSSGETLSNLLGTLVFTSLYSVTSHIHPGICFLFETSIYCVIFVIIVELALSARGVSVCSTGSCCGKSASRLNDDDEDVKLLPDFDDDYDDENSKFKNSKTPERKLFGVKPDSYDRTPDDANRQAIFTTPHN